MWLYDESLHISPKENLHVEQDAKWTYAFKVKFLTLLKFCKKTNETSNEVKPRYPECPRINQGRIAFL